MTATSTYLNRPIRTEAQARRDLGMMTPLEILHARYDGPIPQEARDAVEYATLASRIRRARAAIAVNDGRIAHRKEWWLMERARAIAGGADRCTLRALAKLHATHLLYARRTRIIWAHELTRLEGKA